MRETQEDESDNEENHQMRRVESQFILDKRTGLRTMLKRRRRTRRKRISRRRRRRRAIKRANMRKRKGGHQFVLSWRIRGIVRVSSPHLCKRLKDDD